MEEKVMMEYRARIIILDEGYAVEDGLFSEITQGQYSRAPFIFHTPAVAAQYIQDTARGIQIKMANLEAELKQGNFPGKQPKTDADWDEIRKKYD